jgi:hypothetical protein
MFNKHQLDLFYLFSRAQATGTREQHIAEIGSEAPVSTSMG